MPTINSPASLQLDDCASCCRFCSRRWALYRNGATEHSWSVSSVVTWFVRSIIVMIGLLTALASQAGPGSLDPSFAAANDGSFGKLVRAVGSGTAGTSLNAIAVQPNGAIVVGGTCNVTLTGGLNDGLPHAQFCLQRYRPPPVLITQTWTDSSFGTAGTVTLPIFQNQDARLTSLALTPDGKILAGGTCSIAGTTVFCVVRLLSNGAQDTSFAPNGAGVASVIFSGSATLTTLLPQPDGGIVLAGQCSANSTVHFCLARLAANGEPDSQFGSNGKLLSLTSAGRYVSGATLTSDGSIVVAGTCFDFGANYCVRKYGSTGATDTNFGPAMVGNPAVANTSGTLHVGLGTTTIGASGGIARTASGKFLISGGCIDTPTVANRIIFCTTRVNENGSLDNTFGTNGRAYNIMGGGNSEALNTLVAPDGKYIVTGQCNNPGNGGLDFCAARYHSDGRIDASFDGDGIIGNITSRATARGSAAALQADGRLLLGGACTDAGQQKFCTSRLEGGPYGYQQCSMDIDGDGRVLTTTDALIHARAVAGLSGDAVLSGVSFAPNAQRRTWPAIRDYLFNHCALAVQP